MSVSIHIRVNGTDHRLGVEARETLLEVLRAGLGLFSVHRGCEIGECGACTVLMDNEAVYSCITLAVQADGKDITTLEGLMKDGQLHPLVKAFLDKNGIQCGYCSPGVILTAYAMIGNGDEPDREAIRKGLEGNICRCTGYVNIVNSVEEAVRRKAGGDWW